MKKIKVLQNLYLATLILIAVLVSFYDYLFGKIFGHSFHIEAVISIILLIFAWFVFSRYHEEVEKNFKEMAELKRSDSDYREIVDEAFKYIGSLNVQIDQVRSIFSDLKKFPENKKDFRYIMEYLAEKILGLVPTDFVCFRIVDLDTANTLSEYAVGRRGVPFSGLKISNTMLVGNIEIEGTKVCRTDPRNLSIQAFCLVSPLKLSDEQAVMIEAILNQLKMLYLIFSSNYYTESRLIK